MPVKPTLLERLGIYRFNRAPSAMVDMLGAGSFATLALANDLDLFDALATPRTTDELAATIDADPVALGAMLDVLVANDYVDRSGDRYERSASAERWLSDDGEANMLPWFQFWRDVVFPFWDDHAEAAIREGAPPETLYEWLDDRPEKWPIAQRGFRAAATLLVDPVVDAVDVPDGASSLLDLGGGHGRYAAEFCERNPGLAAVVFDDPAALDVAREEARERGLTDRLETRGGDYLTDDLGTGYDVVLLFNVTHGHDSAGVRTLFERAYDATAPGGRVVVLDQFAGGGRRKLGQAAVSFIAMTYHVTLGQGVHDADDVAAWLRDTGFENVERSGLARDPGSEVLQATKQ